MDEVKNVCPSSEGKHKEVVNPEVLIPLLIIFPPLLSIYEVKLITEGDQVIVFSIDFQSGKET